MSWLHSFLVALQLLTRIPVVKRFEPTESELGHSVVFYPVVGLLIGIVMLIVYVVLPTQDSGLQAALLLAIWVIVSGALHLDGLADSADAWLGGFGSKERTMEIMKDSHNGMAAVVTVTLVLITKFASLDVVLAAIPGWTALLAIPLLSRTAVIGLFLKTPYVRSDGIGAVAAKNLPQKPALIAIAASLILALLFLGLNSFLVIAAMVIVGLLLRLLMMQRIGGTTGDTAGALIELLETTALVAMAMAVG